MLPNSPHLTWRPLTPADSPALLALSDTCRSAVGGFSHGHDAGYLERHFLPENGQGLGGFSAGELAACAGVRFVEKEAEKQAFLAGMVAPAFRKLGIGAALMQWSLDTVQPQFKNVILWTEYLSDDAERLYERFGFERDFAEIVMDLDLADPRPDPDPGGFTLTPWSPELAPAFFKAYCASFADRPGFPNWSQEKWLDWAVEFDDFRPEQSFLARLNGEPAGFIVCSEGWVTQVGVAPAYRRMGLGTLLVEAALAGFQAAGDSRAVLDVNLNNPGAIELYRRLGFTQIGLRGRFIRPNPSNA